MRNNSFFSPPFLSFAKREGCPQGGVGSLRLSTADYYAAGIAPGRTLPTPPLRGTPPSLREGGEKSFIFLPRIIFIA